LSREDAIRNERQFLSPEVPFVSGTSLSTPEAGHCADHTGGKQRKRTRLGDGGGVDFNLVHADIAAEIAAVGTHDDSDARPETGSQSMAIGRDGGTWYHD
jgi:hypothetical protein